VIDPVRQQWEEGMRRLDAEERDPRRHRQLWLLVDVVLGELRRRLGQRFTLAELAGLHRGAEEWARDAVVDSLPPDPRVGVGDVALVVDAAFHLYARGAADYGA
jgi:hypothetical protein